MNWNLKWHFLNLHGWPKRLGQDLTLYTKAQEILREHFKIVFKVNFGHAM